ncbi:MAG: radical SAM protein [Candidatus Aenigmatarchaeota archaeon]
MFSKFYKKFMLQFFYSEKLRSLGKFLIEKFNLAPYPRQIEIEPTTRCSLRCIMCEHTYWNEPNIDMSFEQFKYIIDQFPGLFWIGLTGIGESFLNKDFLKMLYYAKEKGINVELYDNFVYLKKDIAEKIIKDQLITRLYISLDACTKETYEKIRVGAKFENVMKNLNDFLDLKNKIKTKYPKMSFHFIVNKINMHEIPDYVEFVYNLIKDREEGILPTETILFTKILHPFEEIKDIYIEEVPKEIVEEAEKRAKKFGISVKFAVNITKDLPSCKKCFAWLEPFIFADGTVIPCCEQNEFNRRWYQRKYAMGNVFEKPFKEIWNGEKFKELRKTLRKGKFPLACKGCVIYKED